MDRYLLDRSPRHEAALLQTVQRALDDPHCTQETVFGCLRDLVRAEVAPSSAIVQKALDLCAGSDAASGQAHGLMWQAWAGQNPDRQGALRILKDCLASGDSRVCLATMNLDTLPENWPPKLKELELRNNRLTNLPCNLPAGLERLDASINNLTQVAPLPAHLRTLSLAGNRLDQSFDLTDLKDLRKLDLSSNRLRRWEHFFPAQLQVLDLSGNEIASVMTPWPPGLAALGLANNKLCGPAALAALPDGLGSLDITGNPLTSLPKLPADLNNLWVDDRLKADVPQKLRRQSKETPPQIVRV